MAQAAILEMPPAPAPVKEKKRKVRRERGEGRIFKKAGSDRWWIQYYHHGRQIRESCGSDKKSVAVELLRDRLAAASAGATPVVDAKKTTYESMRELLYDYAQTEKLKSLFKKPDGTRCIYTVPPLDRFFKGCTAANITYLRLMAFVKDRQKAGKSPATINRSLESLKRMFDLAIKAKMIPASAVPEFPGLKEPPPRDDYFTLDEYTKVSAELPDYLKPVFAVAFFCGMREKEIITRKWTHVDFEAGETGAIRLLPGETKNDEGRIVPLAGPVAGILKALRAANPNDEFVFTREGKRIKDFRSAWITAVKNAGLTPGRGGHVFHGARRSAITMHAELGMDEQTSMAITGHKDRAVHRRYRQLRDTHVLAAAAKFNAALKEVESTGPATGPAATQRKVQPRK